MTTKKDGKGQFYLGKDFPATRGKGAPPNFYSGSMSVWFDWSMGHGDFHISCVDPQANLCAKRSHACSANNLGGNAQVTWAERTPEARDLAVEGVYNASVLIWNYHPCFQEPLVNMTVYQLCPSALDELNIAESHLWVWCWCWFQESVVFQSTIVRLEVICIHTAGSRGPRNLAKSWIKHIPSYNLTRVRATSRSLQSDLSPSGRCGIPMF